MSSLFISVEGMQMVDLQVSVDPEEWVGKFTHMEVFRSQVSEGGPYEALTSLSWVAATLPETAKSAGVSPGRNVNVVGQTLTVRIGATYQRDVTFTGTNPLTLGACAAQIAAACSPLASAYVDTEGTLAIYTLTVGGSAMLSVEGEAALSLGFTEGEAVFGKEPIIPLSQSKRSYRFRDYFGSPSFYYRTRFCDASATYHSEWSATFTGGSAGDVDPANVAVGYMNLVAQDGRALKGAPVVVYPEQSVQTGANVGSRIITSPPLELKTDAAGHVEFKLLRGLKVTYVVPDIGLVRTITVPNADQFDMTDPSIGVDDVFAVKRIDIAYGERRNF